MNNFQRFLLAFAQLGIFSHGFFLMAADDTKEQEALENTEVELTLPEILLDSKGNNVSSDTLAGKYVGLYFSASWCGPCRAFTPSLITFRNKHGAEFEVVSLPEEMRNKIKDSLDFPDDELFAELQSETYTHMLFDLFPRFYDACKEAPKANSESQASEGNSDTRAAAWHWPMVCLASDSQARTCLCARR